MSRMTGDLLYAPGGFFRFSDGALISAVSAFAASFFKFNFKQTFGPRIHALIASHQSDIGKHTSSSYSCQILPSTSNKISLGVRWQGIPSTDIE